MLRVRRNFKLLQDSLAGEFQALALLLFRDLFGCEQLASAMGRCGFFLLLFD